MSQAIRPPVQLGVSQRAIVVDEGDRVAALPGHPLEPGNQSSGFGNHRPGSASGDVPTIKLGDMRLTRRECAKKPLEDGRNGSTPTRAGRLNRTASPAPGPSS